MFEYRKCQFFIAAIIICLLSSQMVISGQAEESNEMTQETFEDISETEDATVEQTETDIVLEDGSIEFDEEIEQAEDEKTVEEKGIDSELQESHSEEEVSVSENSVTVSENNITVSENKITVSENSITVSENEIAEQDIKYEGSCGENVQFVFEKELGTLSVTGSGALYSYDTFEDLPWYAYYEEINKIEIGNGVKGKLWYFVKKYYRG